MRLELDRRPFATVPAPVDVEGRHVPVSFWHETVSIQPHAALEGDTSCDVVIVGGGFTGLSTAYELKRARPDLDVVLLEHGVVGHGASGRNGGFAMPLLGWDLYYAAQKLGDDGAARAYRFMYGAVDHLKEVAARHEIDCDLEATGYILINTCKRREARARREHALAHKLGFDHSWLDRECLQDYIRSEHYLSGVFDPHPCIINPAKLACGLKAVIEGQGVRIYEQTAAASFEENSDGVRVGTERGSVKARAAVLALNGYGGAMGFMKSRILPVHTYIVLTEPLSEAQLAEIGWAKRRASLETARNLIHYFRLTADNRILFGGEDAELYPGGIYQNQDERIFKQLKDRLLEYFPSLAGVQFTHSWGGVLGVTFDMFPSFGQEGHVFHGAGYSGHGVSLSNYAGTILAPPILEHLGITPSEPAPEAPFFYDRKPAWLPPDPLRYLGLRAYRLGLRAQDRLEGA